MDMKMTRQHFVRLAELCSDVMVETNATKDQATNIMDLFLHMGHESNPNFDPDTFDSAVQKNLGFSPNNS
jgi:hypothetical protein